MQTQINTDDEYRQALRDIETLMLAEFGTETGNQLNRFVTLVEAYEEEQELAEK